MVACPECGLEVKSVAGLRSHQRSRHEGAVRAEPSTVTGRVEVALSGSGSALEPVALRLARMLDDSDTTPRDAAGLSRELRQVLAEIADSRETVDDGIDEVAKRRAARRSASAI